MKEMLFAQVDSLQEEYLQIWEDVTNIESPSAFKEGVDAVGKYFINIATQRGWRVETLPQPVSGDAVCITLNPDVPERPIAISGHMDTVHPVGSFGTPAVKRDGEKIYGPGVLDCKSGIVLGLYLLDVLDRCDYRKRPVKLLLQSDEEVGSRLSNKETINWICKQAKDAVAFFNLENGTEGCAVVSRRGIAVYRFEVSGKKIHAANCYDGANAIAQAAHMIIELEKFKDRETVTCNCGIINGGTATNIVPDSCTFLADFRYTTDEDLARAEEKIAQIAATTYVPGCTVRYERTSQRISMPIIKRNTDLLEKINTILTQNEMPTLAPLKRYSGSDAAYATAAGIPCLDSMGPRGGGVHSEREFAWLSTMPEAARQMAVIICGL